MSDNIESTLEATHSTATPVIVDHRDTNIKQANSCIHHMLDENLPLLALPDNFSRHDIEGYLPHRIRARGNMVTPYLNDFVAYATTHEEAGASVFVDADRIRATAVLNLGTPEQPGHADQLATLAPKRTAAYEALRNATGRPQSQREIAEFLEDWLHCWGAKHYEEDLPQGQALLAIRNLTIEAALKHDHKEESLSASRSTFESVKASSVHKLPSIITFKCKPYPDLAERTFNLRLSVLTTDSKPRFQLRIAALEEHTEQMATEFSVLIREAAESQIPVLIGSYAKGS